MFEPINRSEGNYPNKLYEKIIEQLKIMILHGQIKAGQKLPSERALAEHFKVSRVPVREALKTLEFVGVIEHVSGDGMYVRSLGTDDLLRNLDFALSLPEDTIIDLFEIRMALDIQAVHLAALRRTEEDIEDLKRAVTKMEKEVAEGYCGSEASLEFHSIIARASKNKVICRINISLTELLQDSRKKSLTLQGRPVVALDHHKKILQKIIDQDVTGARKAMREHLKIAEEAIKQI